MGAGHAGAAAAPAAARLQWQQHCYPVVEDAQWEVQQVAWELGAAAPDVELVGSGAIEWSRQRRGAAELYSCSVADAGAGMEGAELMYLAAEMVQPALVGRCSCAVRQ